MSADRDADDDVGRPDDPDGGPMGGRSSRRFGLILVSVVGAANAYEAFAASSTREAIPPTLFVAGAIALGVAAAGPERFKILAFFVGAAFCLGGFAAAV